MLIDEANRARAARGMPPGKWVYKGWRPTITLSGGGGGARHSGQLSLEPKRHPAAFRPRAPVLVGRCHPSDPARRRTVGDLLHRHLPSRSAAATHPRPGPASARTGKARVGRRWPARPKHRALQGPLAEPEPGNLTDTRRHFSSPTERIDSGRTRLGCWIGPKEVDWLLTGTGTSAELRVARRRRSRAAVQPYGGKDTRRHMMSSPSFFDALDRRAARLLSAHGGLAD